MKVLVTGAQGQLGRDFCDVLRGQGVDCLATDCDQIDFLQPESVREGVRAAAPQWVVNCAAYTQVDKAEEDRERAFRINRDAARVLAESARAVNAAVLHVSTDFVFSGQHDQPYLETDAADPLSVYGQSKQEGEAAVLQACPDSIVLRTAWLYGAHGQNFVKTMLRLAGERDELRVVADQLGAPTWTRDLADAMWQLMQKEQRGLFHYCNAGQASWYEFACAIVEEAGALGYPLKVGQVVPIATDEYPTPARRPAYSVLSTKKIQPLLDKAVPHWRQSLGLMLKELQQCPDC
ncbi:MAG: dTDP-4-dehydrorhamnose reductase [Thiogranum sp.]